jgi:hypothetical protein
VTGWDRRCRFCAAVLTLPFSFVDALYLDTRLIRGTSTYLIGPNEAGSVVNEVTRIACVLLSFLGDENAPGQAEVRDTFRPDPSRHREEVNAVRQKSPSELELVLSRTIDLFRELARTKREHTVSGSGSIGLVAFGCKFGQALLGFLPQGCRGRTRRSLGAGPQRHAGYARRAHHDQR